MWLDFTVNIFVEHCTKMNLVRDTHRLVHAGQCKEARVCAWPVCVCVGAYNTEWIWEQRLLLYSDTHSTNLNTKKGVVWAKCLVWRAIDYGLQWNGEILSGKFVWIRLKPRNIDKLNVTNFWKLWISLMILWRILCEAILMNVMKFIANKFISFLSHCKWL